jgi:hypothetical protein
VSLLLIFINIIGIVLRDYLHKTYLYEETIKKTFINSLLIHTIKNGQKKPVSKHKYAAACENYYCK